jgi:thiol-disulfide isomerase/thioredoxin
MARYKFLIWLALVGVLLAACSPSAVQPLALPEITTEIQPTPTDETTRAEGGESTVEERSFAGTNPAPEFPAGLDWLNTDRPLTIQELHGKVILLDFWTYGCINCMHIIPDLQRLEEEFPDELVVVGVHSAKFANEGDTENIRQIILRYDLEHPVINDRDFRVWSIWGARAWPTLALIDPAGNYIGSHSGEGVYPLFQPVIDSLVREFDDLGILDRTPLDIKLESEGLPMTVLSFPGKVLVDAERDRLFIADTANHRIVVAHRESGEVFELIGEGARGLSDGDFRTASFSNPQGMALSEDGRTLYVADTENHALRQVDLEDGTVRTLAGTGVQAHSYPPQPGTAPDVELSSPWDLALDGDTLYIAMAGTHQIWTMDLTSGRVEAFAGSGRESTLNGPLTSAELAQPSGLALDGQGRIYFADSESSSIRWAETDRETGQTGTLAGATSSLFDFGDLDGIGTQARLQHPLGVDFYKGQLYVADTYNHKIKRIDPMTGEVMTFAGGERGWSDGTEPLFYEPGGLDAADGMLYVADTNNHVVRTIDLETGAASTLVLRGIERFLPAAEDADYAGILVELEPVTLQAGEGLITLDVTLPPGYKFNELAPSSMAWIVQDGVVSLPPDADRALDPPTFPLAFEAVFMAGEGSLMADLTLFYCEAESESLCLLEQVRISVPVVVGEGGETALRLEHTISPPEDF